MSRIEKIRQLLSQSPEDEFLRFALAKEYEKDGDDETARKHYDALVADSPEYVGTYYHLGKTLERLNEPAEAFRIYSKGMEMAMRKGEKHARAELAGARLELGDEEDFA